MTSELSHVLEFKDMGLCVSEEDGTVLFQNQLCQSICGEHKASQCHMCSDLRLQHITGNGMVSLLSNSNAQHGDHQIVGDQLCNIYKFSEKNSKQVTILQPIPDQKKQLCLYFQAAGFTEREIDIALLMVENKTNTDIQKVLVITKATLKTHLNHMYKKLPAFKAVRQNKIHNDTTDAVLLSTL